MKSFLPVIETLLISGRGAADEYLGVDSAGEPPPFLPETRTLPSGSKAPRDCRARQGDRRLESKFQSPGGRASLGEINRSLLKPSPPGPSVSQ
jgi:hypothetical protein